MNKYYLSIVFGILGFIFSTKKWLLFLNKLNSLEGCIVYYIAIYLALYFLQYVGLVIADVKIDLQKETFGLLLIIFSFFVLFEWESGWIFHVTSENKNIEEEQVQNCKDITRIYMQSEDGLLYYLWNEIFKFNPEESRILTYIVSPFLLSALGLYLIENKPVNLSL